jgi:hypothetical protein
MAILSRKLFRAWRLHGCVLAGAMVGTTLLSAQQSPALPYRDAEHLVVIRGAPSFPSLADLMDYRAGVPALASIEGLRLSGAQLLGGPDPRPIVELALVTDGWFDQMGMPFAAGHAWAHGKTGRAVIRAEFARRTFGGEAAAIGQTLPIQRIVGPAVAAVREELPVVGVLASDVVLPEKLPLPIDVVVPYVPEPHELEARGARALILIGRVRGPSRFDEAATQVSAVAKRLAEVYRHNKGTDAHLAWLRDEIAKADRTP